MEALQLLVVRRQTSRQRPFQPHGAPPPLHNSLLWSALDPSASTIAQCISIWNAGIVVEEVTPSAAEEAMSPPPSLAPVASQSSAGVEGEGGATPKERREPKKEADVAGGLNAALLPLLSVWGRRAASRGETEEGREEPRNSLSLRGTLHQWARE
jgi:hypothetical protein